jgi:hypothetical protein
MITPIIMITLIGRGGRFKIQDAAIFLGGVKRVTKRLRIAEFIALEQIMKFTKLRQIATESKF